MTIVIPTRSSKLHHSDNRTHTLVPDPTAVRERLEEEEAVKEAQERCRRRDELRTKIDALLFWACSARIMWCFFYQPHRLPPSYLRWISSLAEVDIRLLTAIRQIRTGEWSYLRGSPHHHDVLTDYAASLNYPAVWGDPSVMPPNGGKRATAIWRDVGVIGRDGIGGVPCELVHGAISADLPGLEGSCTVNTAIRGFRAFLRAMAIYVPVHFLPILLTRPNSLLSTTKLISTLLSAGRSATFLSSIVASFWYTVCFTRTLVVARAFPRISHDFIDGPFGAIFAGCLICGNSIWIEKGRRRGEMALYVLPKAFRSCLPLSWLRSGHRIVRFSERLTFILSMASLLTAAIHHPDALRGLSRWTLSFVMKGPSPGFWKRKKEIDSVSSTPIVPPTPVTTRANTTDATTPIPPTPLRCKGVPLWASIPSKDGVNDRKRNSLQ